MNDIHVVNSNVVNELRLGFNRIHITFVANNTLNAADYGIDSGVTSAIGLPQISVAGGQLRFGGANGFPQGRGDYTAVLSDTLSWTHGQHAFKFGAEYRRVDNNNFGLTPGTFTFTNVAAFIADQATGFTSNPSNGASRIYVNSLGAFALDQWKITPRFMLDLGIRYDWYGTPTEAMDRFVVFDPAAGRLVQTHQPYKQSV